MMDGQEQEKFQPGRTQNELCELWAASWPQDFPKYFQTWVLTVIFLLTISSGTSLSISVEPIAVLMLSQHRSGGLRLQPRTFFCWDETI